MQVVPAGELTKKAAVRPRATMGIWVRIHWIGYTMKSIPGPRLATNRSVLFALGHSSECPLSPCRAFVCEHAGRMPLTRMQSVVAWAHRTGSLFLVCHGIGMDPGREWSLFNFVAPPSVLRSHHLHTRNEAEIQVRSSPGGNSQLCCRGFGISPVGMVICVYSLRLYDWRALRPTLCAYCAALYQYVTPTVFCRF